MNNALTLAEKIIRGNLTEATLTVDSKEVTSMWGEVSDALRRARDLIQRRSYGTQTAMAAISAINSLESMAADLERADGYTAIQWISNVRTGLGKLEAAIKREYPK